MIARYKNLAVAFSGGVDSVFLAAIAKKVLNNGVVLLTLDSELQSRQDTHHAIYMAGETGLTHEIIHMDPWASDAIIKNEKDRCYHCKRKGFSLLRAAADQRGIPALAHGVNLNDLSDYRPGLQAAHELGILAPLADAGLTKEEIREASKKMGLSTWNMPSQSCLATRIPYGEPLTRQKLKQINDAETILQQFGFEGVRVRCHGSLARIECKPKEIEKISSLPLRKKITAALKTVGFKFISVDLEGYAGGKMNRVLNHDG